MTLYYKTKDGKIQLVQVTRVEIDGIENARIKDGTWIFDSTGGSDGRKDV